MNLFELFSAAELEAQIEAGMVKATRHAGGTLTILNYTRRAQYTPELWTHVTDKCRGLIVDQDSTIVARPFEKFWNLDDPRHPETLTANLPASEPAITRKLDGSLGIGYPLDGRWYVATRGAFESEQAQWASAWLEAHSPSLWPAGWTPLFEIVYPENQVVVHYDFAGLVLLALVDIATGEEAVHAELQRLAEANGVRCVQSYNGRLADFAAEDVRNEEGYVAAWPRAGTTPLRCKIKYANYVRLHRLLTGTNAVTVWEMLRDGLDIGELTTDVPAQFRAWIDAMRERFTEAYAGIEDAAKEAFAAYPGSKDAADPEQKKLFASYVQQRPKELAPILFAMISGKRYDPMIWKLIRPRGDEGTFKTEEE